MEAILRDPRRKATLLQRMGLEDQAEPERQSGNRSHLAPSGMGLPARAFQAGALRVFPVSQPRAVVRKVSRRGRGFNTASEAL